MMVRASILPVSISNLGKCELLHWVDRASGTPISEKFSGSTATELDMPGCKFKITNMEFGPDYIGFETEGEISEKEAEDICTKLSNTTGVTVFHILNSTNSGGEIVECS